MTLKKDSVWVGAAPQLIPNLPTLTAAWGTERFLPSPHSGRPDKEEPWRLPVEAVSSSGQAEKQVGRASQPWGIPPGTLS